MIKAGVNNMADCLSSMEDMFKLLVDMIEGNEDGQFGSQYISPGVAKEVAEIYKKLKRNDRL